MNNKSDARMYLNKVIDINSGSDAAQIAGELLKKL